MDESAFRIPLYLPAQGATETEATLIEWHVAEGDSFEKGQILAQVDSVKSVFDFEAPCSGRVVKILHLEGETIPYTEPLLEIETTDQGMKDWIPPAVSVSSFEPRQQPMSDRRPRDGDRPAAVILGVGGYLPERVVTNEDLVRWFPDVSADYVYQVTGIRQRRWAQDGEKPSDMAYAASLEAIRKANIGIKDIDAIILATTTPDVAMPSTACILQDRLGLGGIPAFDLNAACSGWLYAVAMAQNMILTSMARNVLAVGVDIQSRLLDKSDRNTCFIFGDGAGAAVISAANSGHSICRVILSSDVRGLHMARREQPGYLVANGYAEVDPWIRLDGQALFRYATESFIHIIRELLDYAGWGADETRWVIPHQANGRILKAAAKRSGVSFDRFFLNVERVGNTSSASIPLAIIEAEEGLRSGDKLVLCSVGAGLTTAAIAVEW